MMSPLIRPLSLTFRPAALAPAPTALRSTGEPAGRRPPRRRPPRGARPPASLKGASALSSLARVFLPRSLSLVTPSNPNNKTSPPYTYNTIAEGATYIGNQVIPHGVPFLAALPGQTAGHFVARVISTPNKSLCQ